MVACANSGSCCQTGQDRKAQPSVGIRVLQASKLGRRRMLYTILLIILILALIGGLPTWPYSEHWGYFPSGGIGLVLVILIILLVVRRA
jgi:hypothetical protein